MPPIPQPFVHAPESVFHTVVRSLYGSMWPPLIVSRMPREDFDEDDIIVPLDMDAEYR